MSSPHWCSGLYFSNLQWNCALWWLFVALCLLVFSMLLRRYSASVSFYQRIWRYINFYLYLYCIVLVWVCSRDSMCNCKCIWRTDALRWWQYIGVGRFWLTSFLRRNCERSLVDILSTVGGIDRIAYSEFVRLFMSFADYRVHTVADIEP